MEKPWTKVLYKKGKRNFFSQPEDCCLQSTTNEQRASPGSQQQRRNWAWFSSSSSPPSSLSSPGTEDSSPLLKDQNFKIKVRLLYKLLQASHHLKNVCNQNCCPPAIQRITDHLICVIKAAQTNRKLSDLIFKNAKLWQYNTLQNLKQHYQDQIETLKDNVIDLGGDMAGPLGVAGNWAKRNLGRRFRSQTLEEVQSLLLSNEKINQPTCVTAETSDDDVTTLPSLGLDFSTGQVVGHSNSGRRASSLESAGLDPPPPELQSTAGASQPGMQHPLIAEGLEMRIKREATHTSGDIQSTLLSRSKLRPPALQRPLQEPAGDLRPTQTAYKGKLQSTELMEAPPPGGKRGSIFTRRDTQLTPLSRSGLPPPTLQVPSREPAGDLRPAQIVHKKRHQSELMRMIKMETHSHRLYFARKHFRLPPTLHV